MTRTLIEVRTLMLVLLHSGCLDLHLSKAKLELRLLLLLHTVVSVVGQVGIKDRRRAV